VRGAGGDPDALVRAHARDALAAVDAVMRAFMGGAAAAGAGSGSGGANGPRLRYL